MSLVSDLFYFFKKPKNFKKEEVGFLTVFKEFIIYDLIITLLWAFLVAIMSLTFEDFATVFGSKKSLGGTGVNIFFIGAFVAPLVEELAYRLGLRINRVNISISLGVQIVLYLHLLKVFVLPLYARVGLMALLSLILYLTISKKLRTFLSKKYNYFFYFNLIVFSLLHALNFSYFEWFHYLFIPILISLQFLFGLYLSYTRLSQNFLYVVVFHIIHNSLILGLSFLTI